jgi:hypothetical protein
MTTFIRISLRVTFGLLGLLVISATAIANPLEDRVCVYADTNYRGHSDCWNIGENTANLGKIGWGDRISSIRVSGRARALVYKDKNYKGKSLEISSDVSDLKSLGWNDRISSIKIVSASRDWYQLPGYDRRDDGWSLTGRLLWSGRVDGEVEILVRGGDVNVRTTSGTPVYTGRVSLPSPLPSRNATVRVKRISGRGSIDVVQQPDGSNNHTAIVRIRDAARGADDYEFELTW